MATKSLIALEYVKERAGGSMCEVQHIAEAASQSFIKGQLVYLASGKVTACADDAVSIWGIAMEAASGTTNTKIAVLPLTVNSVMSACVYHATAASAITALTGLGLMRPLQVDSNKCYCDVTDQTTPCFVVYDIDPRDEVGDIYGRYYVTLIATTLQVNVGA